MSSGNNLFTSTSDRNHRLCASTAGLILFLLAVLHGPQSQAADQTPTFALPVICAIGKDCFIQNYVDLATGPAIEDHACGQLSYDGHKGTDIRVPDLSVLKNGIKVVAAAPGRVTATRDGMRDLDVREAGARSVRDMECGNGVIIDHGNGWTSKYCHMRRGSILTPNGSVVETGQALGLMGLSGKTAFPHLHFEISHKGEHIDPFTGLHQRPAGWCDSTDLTPALWSKSAAEVLKYRTSGIIRSGFATRKPDIKSIENGDFGKSEAAVDVPVFIYWVKMYGMRPGDRSEVLVKFPDGSVLARSAEVHKGRHKAQWYTFVGKRRPKSGSWPSGRYSGQYRLSRKSDEDVWREVIDIKREFVLREVIGDTR
jgi:hypothetical protein